ncbi:MAG: hypothetical protein EP330_30925 [Deltaproteobacteria bacterium]|nr:MAG: hypothetical protein EP330_30925 [Deltaproteobacteria bacterium]
MNALDEVKTRAALLHKAALRGDADALRALPTDPRRKHALEAVARRLGFRHYRHAHAVLTGEASELGWGKLLVPGHGGGFLNHWFADHEEATAHLRASGGYLLGYAQQYVVVGETYVEDVLGLDPEAPEWWTLGWDWTNPGGAEARRTLYAALLVARRPVAC